MDHLDRKVLAGLMAASAVTVTLFAYMHMQQERAEPLADEIVEGCRSLMRESADIMVEVARDDLNPDEPGDLPKLHDIQTRIYEIEAEMAGLGCYETQEKWAYGSFKQEMSEYEAYIAELIRDDYAGGP